MLRTFQVMGCGLLMVAAAQGIQRRVAPGAQRPTVAVTIALQSAGGPYQFSGEGRCTYAPTASIYGILSEQWSVQQSEGSRSMALTFWKPKKGAETMFTLSMSSGSKSESVSTVKAPEAPAPEGSGTATFEPAGKGGTFKIAAKNARGGAITGTIRCDAFTPAIAEGGN